MLKERKMGKPTLRKIKSTLRDYIAMSTVSPSLQYY